MPVPLYLVLEGLFDWTAPNITSRLKISKLCYIVLTTVISCDDNGRHSGLQYFNINIFRRPRVRIRSLENYIKIQHVCPIKNAIKTKNPSNRDRTSGLGITWYPLQSHALPNWATEGLLEAVQVHALSMSIYIATYCATSESLPVSLQLTFLEARSVIQGKSLAVSNGSNIPTLAESPVLALIKRYVLQN